MNIHNLKGINPLQRYFYITVGLIGGLGWIFAKFTRNEVRKFLRFWLPDYRFVFYFLPLLINLFDGKIQQMEFEVVELLFSLGVFVYMLKKLDVRSMWISNGTNF